jgi:hypothetical protein
LEVGGWVGDELKGDGVLLPLGGDGNGEA